MKVLITGGCGFIGTNIISKLLRDSQYNKIYILDNFSNSNIKNFKKFMFFNWRKKFNYTKGKNIQGRY